jgi:hypothetical protein
VNDNERAKFKLRAVEWLRVHVEKINLGDRQAVIDDLFAAPGVKYEGRESYASSMAELAPVTLLTASATDPDERETKHGRVLAFWLEATIRTKMGDERRDDFPVWWLVEKSGFVIAGRPTRWLAR